MSSELRKLKTLELVILLQHIRLGLQNLNKFLNKQQFDDLLSNKEISLDQHNKVKSEDIEKTGNFALALNTIFTCSVGAWLGTAGFIGTGLGSPIVLLIMTLIAIIISGFLGYHNYQTFSRKTKTAYTTIRLNVIELYIITLINEKRRQDIAEHMQFLNKTLQALAQDKDDIEENISDCSFDSKEKILDWINQLNDVLEQKANQLSHDAIYELYIEELAECKNKLKKILSKNVTIYDNQPETAKAVLKDTNWQFKTVEQSYIKVLTNPTMSVPKAKIKHKTWLRANIAELLVGLIPTVLGGFGSMFVYFVGIPDIFQRYGNPAIKGFTMNPFAKPVELILALLITSYFGYTFARSNFKAFHRQQEIDKLQTKIANEEALMIEINAKLNFLRKLKQQVTHIAYIFRVLRRLSITLKKLQVSSVNVKNQVN